MALDAMGDSHDSHPGAHAVTPAPPSAVAGEPRERPRWHAHPYNRASFYRLAALGGGLPRPARLGLARLVARVMASRFPAERAAVRRTLERTTGAAGPRLSALTAATFQNFAMCFSDLVSTNRRGPARLATHVASVSGAAALEGHEGGVVSLTAHVGNWEMAGRLLARQTGRPTHVVVAEEEMPALERWVRRAGDGVRFVPRSRPTVSVELVAALRRGEVVAIQGDRALGSRGDLAVPFFGRSAPFPTGPFTLARATGVPVIAAFCLLRPDRRYDVIVLRPLRVSRGEEEDAARTWVADLEGVVRQRPTQWFNFFDVWSPFGP
jgi:lauroyl/myristoyl acyltransferase